MPVWTFSPFVVGGVDAFAFLRAVQNVLCSFKVSLLRCHSLSR